MKPYFEKDDITIYCGNSLEVMPGLEPVDLVVTSPPYDELRNYKGYVFDFEAIAIELYRVVKGGGVVVWVVGDATINGSETGTSFKQALYFKEIGFNLHDTMIYDKDKPPGNSNRYEQKFEYMFIFSKGSPQVFNPITVKAESGGRINKSVTDRQKNGDLKHRKASIVKIYKTKGNIWHYGIGFQKTTKDKIAYEHPAIFPEQLAADHIISWSNENDIVFDPMCGSGTTLKMAKELGRKAIGIEIEEKYCEIAANRVEKAIKRDRASFHLERKKQRKTLNL